MDKDGPETMREAVARAIEDADGGIGYQIKLVSLVDSVSTYALDYDDGSPVLEFESYSDALDHFQSRRADARADAAIRTVLERLREPTPDMVEGGRIGLSNSGVDDANDDDATSCWQAMLDAAITPPLPESADSDRG